MGLYFETNSFKYTPFSAKMTLIIGYGFRGKNGTSRTNLIQVPQNNVIWSFFSLSFFIFYSASMVGKNVEIGKLLPRKCWCLVGNFVFLYIKTCNKLWETWPASREINIFSSPASSSAPSSSTLSSTLG